ncbi:MAG: lysophospholipid acyltransferase family protein [Pseudomonadota bacterium]|nr:lysophospholipid acyltransferase family protein [Pseudomonadota bacterium]
MKTLKALTGYLVIGVIRLLSLMPLGLAQRGGRLLGRMLWWRRTRSREVARVNIRHCYPQLNAAEQEQLVHDTLLQNGMVAAEMGAMWGYSPQRCLQLIRHVHNKNLLDDALADERGLLVLAPHLGNWELLNTYLAAQAELTAMYRPAKNAVFDQWMHRRREATGGNLVPTTSAGVKALFSTLRKGGMVGVLPDQEPKERSGIFAPFMGMSALTPKMPQELLARTGARAVFAFTRRLPEGKGFDVYFLAADEAIYADDREVAAAAMNRGVEACVEHCPEQYQWTYKRFKRQPGGGKEKDPYRIAGVP